MSDNLLTIMWNKIAALTGGSSEWPIGLGLRPWYLKVIVIQAQPENDRIVAKAGSLRASLSAGRLGCWFPLPILSVTSFTLIRLPEL